MQLSVILSIYNAFDYQRLYFTVQSLREQKGVEMEIVLAESNTKPGFAARSKELGIRYAFEPSGVIANPGHVRNLALAAAVGDFIYSTDADIIFPQHFMADLLTLPAQVWIHPPKRRLPKDQFLHFHDRVTAQGLEATLVELCNDPYVTSFKDPIQYKLTEKEGRHYTCIQSDYNLWRSSPEMRLRAPVFWDSTRHRGGTLAPKVLWHEVGGYSEVYQTWGYEDVDVQWKLEQKSPVAHIPDEERFRALHLDHDKSYFTPQHNTDNQHKFQHRKSNPTLAIAHDKLSFKATES
jgi:hypothetical protein